MKCLSISIKGKVQGVFFRLEAREQAQRLGLSGFARNQPDGSVYIEAEGQEAALHQFLAWCHQGPTNSEVISVTHTEHNPTGQTGFDIRP